MKDFGIALFLVLVIGSVIFFFILHNATVAYGDGMFPYIYALRRGLHTIGNYLIFVSMVFGVNFLLVKKK